MSEKSLTAEQEAIRSGWEYRSIVACRGNTTVDGCLLIAFVGKMASNPPRIMSGARIDVDGNIFCTQQLEAGDANILPMAYLCTVDELLGRFSRLCDNLKFTDLERVQLFTKMRNWVFKDDRGEKVLEYRK